MDPKAILSDAKTLNLIDSLCNEHCLDENEALECSVYVSKDLEKNDYHKLRLFKGKAKLSTFLYGVTVNSIIDFKRGRYGRNRIPKGVQELGDWAERLYSLICWFNHELREAYDIMRIQGLYKGSYTEFLGDAEKVREATCRKNPRWHSLEKAQEAGFDPASAADNPLEALLKKLEWERAVEARPTMHSYCASLTVEEQSLLFMVCAEDHSLITVARSVGMKPAVAKKRLAEIMQELKEHLIAAGIRRDEDDDDEAG